MNTLRIEITQDDTVINTLEESTDQPSRLWLYGYALSSLRPGQTFKFYINGNQEL